MSTSYWRSSAEDEAMQDEHGFLWKAMLDTIDTELTGRRVLDAGCNRGGFLRLLVDTAGIAEGDGYDPASGAITDARRSPETDHSRSRSPIRCHESGLSLMWPSVTRSSTCSRTSQSTRLISLAP